MFCMLCHVLAVRCATCLRARVCRQILLAAQDGCCSTTLRRSRTFWLLRQRGCHTSPPCGWACTVFGPELGAAMSQPSLSTQLGNGSSTAWAAEATCARPFRPCRRSTRSDEAIMPGTRPPPSTLAPATDPSHLHGDVLARAGRNTALKFAKPTKLTPHWCAMSSWPKVATWWPCRALSKTTRPAASTRCKYVHKGLLPEPDSSCSCLWLSTD